MNNFTFLLFFIPGLTLILLTLSFFFSIRKPYLEKKSTFECGYHSFIGQNRTPFNISFFIYGLMFLIFDLEILLLAPFILSAYTNQLYGLMVVEIFIITLTIGFVYELGKKALDFNYNKQPNKNENKKNENK